MTEETTPSRTVAEIDCTTNTMTYREMTAEEIEAQILVEQEASAIEAERSAAAEALEALKVSARAKLVAGEPLTEEEAAVLVI